MAYKCSHQLVEISEMRQPGNTLRELCARCGMERLTVFPSREPTVIVLEDGVVPQEEAEVFCQDAQA